MPLVEPAIKRAVAFIDGQNLFHHSRDAFGYHFPNYDIRKLVDRVATEQHWNLVGVYFYTGVPDATDDPRWNRFWTNKLASMGRQGITVFTRALRYRNKTVRLPDGTAHSFLHGEEKGIDVRIALDVIGKAVRNEYDVAIVFSQDQDMSEVADEIRIIARQQDRWIRMACAYPVSPTISNRRGINGTQWIQIDRNLYDACLDTKDYR
ncbi:MAG TPA: NYN domain-containing protein [Acidobacteriaceae bacterium]